MRLVTRLFQMEWINWGGHCHWSIPKRGCLIGGDLWHTLINWGGRIQRIQKHMASGKKGLSNWGGKLIGYWHYPYFWKHPNDLFVWYCYVVFCPWGRVMWFFNCTVMFCKNTIHHGIHIVGEPYRICKNIVVNIDVLGLNNAWVYIV